MKKLILPLAGALMAAALAGGPIPVAAQAPPGLEHVNCGTWDHGAWTPNGACAPDDYRSRVAGTITFVKGHLVTLQRTADTLVIDDQQALDHRTTGRVAVGRSVVAWGYWRSGVFYATALV